MTNRAFVAGICVVLSWLLVVDSSMTFAEDLKEAARSVRWSKLRLESERPPDLDIDVKFAEGEGLFAEWVYGTPDSARVAVAVLPDANDAIRIYLDRDRDRRIKDRELTDVDELFFSKLDAQHFDGEKLKDYPRNVALKYREGDDSVSVATLTRQTHSVTAGDSKKSLTVQQVDLDANGLYADPRDQIQIDLDGNGKFNPFLETFPMRPVMKVRGKRWFVKADRFGERIHLDSATATGKVQMKAEGHSETDKITSLVLTLTGEDGSVYTLDDPAKATELPVGKYYASVLYVTLQPKGGRAWTFTFSSSGRPAEEKMIDVSQGVETVIDPIGSLSFDAELGKLNAQKGQLSIQPRLFTETGMLINLCEQEGVKMWSGPQCEVRVLDKNDAHLGQSSSGFA